MDFVPQQQLSKRNETRIFDSFAGNASSLLACVAADFFPFPGGGRTTERKSGRAKEHAWGEQKKWEEVGRG